VTRVWCTNTLEIGPSFSDLRDAEALLSKLDELIAVVL
jgi:hypothetical protein